MALILLIYIAPLISMSVAFYVQSKTHSSHVMMASSHSLSESTHKASPHQHSSKSQDHSVHHAHAWCGYCDLLANISATLTTVAIMPSAMLIFIALLAIEKVRLGQFFSFLFPTPRAPPSILFI
ncbi:DUF2946 domain-containing protein [Vibrio gangliei]|uniref:DUF2946 domain-containing protein n=1 Tax=Vibrio gangliei TaxID=2077090 RepID=UPI0022307FBA|nr:DUF2946 domain-containing protein [Vibrio gangliei]